MAEDGWGWDNIFDWLISSDPDTGEQIWNTNKDTGKQTPSLNPDALGLFGALGGLLGAGGAFSPNIPTTGYQGKVPKYRAVRERVANTYDPNRRPGSGGRRYFSDVQYVPMDTETSTQDIENAIAAAKTQAGALEAANLANPADEIRNIADTPVTETPVNEEPLALPTAPTAQSMMPTTESPFTDPYQHIANDPTNPLNLNKGGKVKKYEAGGIVELIEMLRSAPEILAYLGAGTGLAGLGSYGVHKGMNEYREAEAEKRKRGFNLGGIAQLQSRYLNGTTDGMADSVPAMIDNQDPAALSDGEYVVAADVVSGIGNGNSNAGARKLDQMMSNIRQARTGTTKQAPAIDFNNILST